MPATTRDIHWFQSRGSYVLRLQFSDLCIYYYYLHIPFNAQQTSNHLPLQHYVENKHANILQC